MTHCPRHSFSSMRRVVVASLVGISVAVSAYVVAMLAVTTACVPAPPETAKADLHGELRQTPGVRAAR